MNINIGQNLRAGLTDMRVEESRVEYICELLCDLDALEDDPHARKRVAECWHRPSVIDLLMNVIDKLIGGHGVESWSPPNRSWRMQPLITFINTGDTYSPTVIYHADKNEIYVGCWGDEVESAEREAQDDDE